MKQIIEKNNNGSIRNKYYLNHLGQANGLAIDYYTNGNISWKLNYINGKRFGISNSYVNNKPYKITYYI